ncbi:uncharacterized protein LACBIDRAFT_298900 [Laccaria bicolor S238N-H82]|uniref:Predicted protein n=1 Tax=Laccaria bicolor (strain S238N-H82 / ATCC MYA-4686) TaxID=486041 RepID=B0DE93_LACBS|nr:uncharacterized protein LACBIDRAFT_298900 [Laccaria bicolor S238N-H82]EDR07227.1 predicted protein [Laccaria bicolor S238N-H82]|eukprot:XP_001882158.1 predicted protein [Laccaria bicolor S238N-H82]
MWTSFARSCSPMFQPVASFFRGVITNKHGACRIICETWTLFVRSRTLTPQLVAMHWGETSPKFTEYVILFGKHGPFFLEAAHRHSSSSQCFLGRHHQKTRSMTYCLGDVRPVCEKLRVEVRTRRNALKHHQQMQYYLRNMGPLFENLYINVCARRKLFWGCHQKTQSMSYYYPIPSWRISSSCCKEDHSVIGLD